MKKFLVVLAALLLSTSVASAQCTVAKNKTALTTEINTNFADNVIGSITPLIARNTFIDFLNSWQQAPAVNAQSGTSYTVVLNDYGQLVTLNNGAAVAVTLPQATGSFACFSFMASNLGAGTVTITPTVSTINGATTFTMLSGNGAVIVSDGTNYQAMNILGARSATALIANGGTSQTTAPAARAAAGLNIDAFRGIGDTAASIAATDRVVGTNATFTASRTWTLPAANAVNPGQLLLITDFQGTVTGTNTLVIARAGADTINGGTSVTIAAANGGFVLASDGTSKWTAQAIGGAAGGVTSIGGVSGVIGLGAQLTMSGSNLTLTTTTGPTTQVITSTGTYTAATNAVKVLAYVKGAGGGGGGSSSATANGGGGGEGAESWLMATRAAITGLTCTIGTGGTSVALNTNSAGGNGGTTSVGTVITAGGGAGGASGNNGGQGGAGGANGTRDWGMPGALGYNGSNPAANIVLAAGGGGKGGGQLTAAGTANSGGGGGGGTTAVASGAGGSGLCTFTEFYQ